MHNIWPYRITLASGMQQWNQVLLVDRIVHKAIVPIVILLLAAALINHTVDDAQRDTQNGEVEGEVEYISYSFTMKEKVNGDDTTMLVS